MENVYDKIRAERMAWKEKFDSATPEEQNKMLAERCEQRKEEEERHQKMIYDDRKKRFFEQSNEWIACYELLKKAQSIALEVCESFDGKILNNRLTNAINERLQAEINRYVTASLLISYSHEFENNVGTMTIKDVNHFGCDNKCSFKIILSPVLDGNRIEWSKSLDYMTTPCGKLFDFDERIANRKAAKKGYDKTYKKAKKIEEIIKDYTKEDYLLRGFLKREYVINNLSSI